MCIVCNAPDATYNYNNTYTNINTNINNYNIISTTDTTTTESGLRRKIRHNPIVIHRLWKKMCTPLWIGCAQTVY